MNVLAPFPRAAARAALVLLASALRLGAQDTVQVVGAARVPLPAVGEGDSVVVPLRYARAPAAAAPVVSVLQVVHDGRLLAPTAFRAALRPRCLTADAPPALVVHADAALTRGAGEYATLVEVLAPAAAGNRPATQDVALTFVRPAAQLDSLPTLRVAHVVYWPWWPGVATHEPDRVTLTEVGGRVAFVPDTTAVWGDLRRADVAASGARVGLGLPARVAAGRQGVATLAIDGMPGAGTSSARLRVGSATVAGGAATLVVEVVSRLSLAWLVAAIAAGVAAGYYVRRVLEGRRLIALALAAAGTERARIDALLAEAHDPPLCADLDAARRALVKDAGTPGAPADAVTTAVHTAGAARTGALDRANARYKTVADALAPWTRELPTADAVPAALRAAVAPVRAAVGAAGKLLAGGWTSKAADQLHTAGVAVADAARAGEDWATGIANLLGAADPWPDTAFGSHALDLEKTAADCRDLFAAAAGAGADAPGTAPALGAALRAAVTLDAAFTGGVLAYDIPAIVAQARADVATITEWKLASDGTAAAKVGDAADAITAALAPVAPGANGAVAVVDLHTLGDRLRGLADALRGLLDETCDAVRQLKPGADASADDALAATIHDEIDAGKFGHALQLLDTWRRRPDATVTHKSIRGDAPAGVPFATGAITGPVTTREVAVAAMPDLTPPRAAAGLVIDVDPATAGLETVVRLRVDGADASALQNVRWYADGHPIVLAPAAPNAWTLRPAREGSLFLRAVARLAPDGPDFTAERLVQVRDPLGDPNTRKREADRAERHQTALVGVVTLLVGLLLFRNAFVGTPEQLVVPFLWGFLIDVSVAQLRTSSAPLLARTVPLPG
ncbi:hypothetical protein tb265_19910 [Gemmatimonadetes bacterium T265]|nr:hypothetical protein tb265_19910 [Gemmatimonadetes bacterium T265]